MRNVNSLMAWELGYESDFAGSEFGDLLTSDDLEAIQKFFADSTAKTSAAIKIKDQFTKWYDDLYWYQKNYQSNLDIARNYRNSYNLANAISDQEKQNVETVIKTGISREQAMGEADRRLASGMYPDHPEPFISDKVKIGGAIVLAIALIAAAHAAPSAILARK